MSEMGYRNKGLHKWDEISCSIKFQVYFKDYDFCEIWGNFVNNCVIKDRI